MIFSNANFGALVEEYHNSHYEAVEDDRFTLSVDRLVEAWFLYAFLGNCDIFKIINFA